MSGPLSLVWVPSSCQAMENETLVIFNFQPKLFWFFTIFWSYSFLQSMFFKWVFCFIQNVAFSDGRKVMHIAWKVKLFRQYVQQWLLTQVLSGSDLFYGFIAGNCQKKTFPRLLLTPSRTFHPVAQQKLSGLYDGHWNARRGNSELFQVTLGLGKWSG